MPISCLMGMKCDVCGKDGLSWWKKSLMAFSLPLKCSHCDARYHLRFFRNTFNKNTLVLHDFLVSLITTIIPLPLILFLFWYFDKLSWPTGLIIGVLIWIFIAMITPHRINHKDPVNVIIQRIQAKKQQLKSSEVSSDS